MAETIIDKGMVGLTLKCARHGTEVWAIHKGKRLVVMCPTCEAELVLSQFMPELKQNFAALLKTNKHRAKTNSRAPRIN